MGEPLDVDSPPELTAGVRRVCRAAARDGLLPHGYTLAAPNTLTEVWTFLAAGVPALNVSSFDERWYRSEYHTQYDTSERLDFDYLARQTRLYARFLLEADGAPDANLDFRARAAHLRQALARVPASPSRSRVEASLARLAGLHARADFTPLARGLHGLDAWGRSAYPHEQAARDARALEAALAALRSRRPRLAARRLATAGLNDLGADLSREAFRLEHARAGARAPRACWAAQGRLDPGPDLWEELASLRGEPGSRPSGPWLEASLERRLGQARTELVRRLDRMARTLEGRRIPLARGAYPSDGRP